MDSLVQSGENYIGVTPAQAEGDAHYAEISSAAGCLPEMLPAAAEQTAAHHHTASGAWGSDSESHWQLCSCGTALGRYPHSFGGWTVETAATRKSDGSKIRVCSVCGYTETQVIPAQQGVFGFLSAWFTQLFRPLYDFLLMLLIRIFSR